MRSLQLEQASILPSAIQWQNVPGNQLIQLSCKVGKCYNHHVTDKERRYKDYI